MTKEELRQEFSNEIMKYNGHVSAMFEWFYGRMLAKDKEIEHWEGKSKEHFESFLLLTAKLKAADEVIECWDIHCKHNFSDDPERITNLMEALEHYKSLK